jgi:hypothetical protein
MRYFLPNFKIASMEPPQDRLRSKIGGVPWGLPPHRWPYHCGHPQKLLAQFLHEPPMLDLGEHGAVLHLFQCMHCIGIGRRGGRAAFILSRAAMGDGPVTVPDYDAPSEYGERLIGELWIDGFEGRDDGVPPSRLADFYQWETWSPLTDEFPTMNWFNSKEATRFGAPPMWTGYGPLEIPPPPFEFLLQLNESIHFQGPLPSPDDVGCFVHLFECKPGHVTECTTTRPSAGKERLNAPWDLSGNAHDSEYWASYTNLGTDGIVFVYIDRTRIPHKVRWYWNR